MSENRPPPPDRKLGLIAPISIAIGVALILLVAVLFRGGAQEAPAPPPAPAQAVPTPVAEPPPAEIAVLERADLLRVAAARTEAYASDDAARPAREALAGRRFIVRIPFGCEGPQVRPGAAQAYYEFDPETRTIRLVARPSVWTTLPLFQELPESDIEAVEGFWLPRPWSSLEGCPTRKDRPAPAAPSPLAAQSLGLAQLFEEGSSRVGRRGDRPYEHVIKLGEADRPPLIEGYRMTLEGRLTAFPGGRSIRCWSESPDHRPLCIYAVELERVAFEDAQGKMLAEWRD